MFAVNSGAVVIILEIEVAVLQLLVMLIELELKSPTQVAGKLTLCVLNSSNRHCNTSIVIGSVWIGWVSSLVMRSISAFQVPASRFWASKVNVKVTLSPGAIVPVPLSVFVIH